MSIYHLRSFDLTGGAIPVRRLSAFSDREAISVARDMVKGADTAGFELWAGRRCVCIEPHKIPATESEIKAEWERRTESIRRHRSDVTFRSSPELYTREFGLTASTSGDVETNGVDRETDADAITLDWRPPADEPRPEDWGLPRESQRLTSDVRKRSKEVIPIPSRKQTDEPTFLRSSIGGMIPPVLAAVVICSLAAWQYLEIPLEGRGPASAVLPSSLLVPPSSEISASPTSAAAQTPDPMAAAANQFLSAPLPVPAPASAPSLAPSSPGVGMPAATSVTESASAGGSTPSPESAADTAHIFGITGQTGFRITLRATAETWLEVKDGTTSIFRRLMTPGDEYRLPEKAGLIMRVGNAQGIEVLVDGKPLPGSSQPNQHRRTVVNLDPQTLIARAELQ